MTSLRFSQTLACENQKFLMLLLTNDDGYFAPGLAALEAIAREFDDVAIVAPEVEQSYMGHRVTTGAPLRSIEYGPSRWHVNGTPADCVRVALRALHLKPSWVLSGINRGGNLGVDVYTSGTVAAAREAAILGVPAIAISQYVKATRILDWEESKILARHALTHLLSAAPPPAGALWNVNLPHESAAAIIECPLDPSPQDVRFELEGESIRYAGRYAERPRIQGLDISHCFGGSITLTRLPI